MVAFSLFMSGARAADSIETILSVPPEDFMASKDKDRANFRFYMKPGADLKAYSSLIIEPLGYIERDSTGAWSLLVSDDKSKIDASFRKSMTDALRAQHIAVVTEPGPGVARLRVAVTGLQQVKPDFKVRDLVPVKLVFNIVRNAAGAEPYLLDVSTVSQLSDSQSGDLLAGGINKLQDSETKKVAEPITAEYLKKMVDKETKLGAISLAKAMTPKP
jgi:hypothetical protein